MPDARRTTRDVIRDDLVANADPRSKISLVLFRLASDTSLPQLVRIPICVVYTVLVCWLFGIELPIGTPVGPGLQLMHATGLVVSPFAVIGAGCTLKHGCTIGVRRSGEGAPVLEDGVVLGASSHVVGNITLGRGSETGAGAVVLADVPAGHLAVGNPARIVPRGATAGRATGASAPA